MKAKFESQLRPMRANIPGSTGTGGEHKGGRGPGVKVIALAAGVFAVALGVAGVARLASHGNQHENGSDQASPSNRPSAATVQAGLSAAALKLLNTREEAWATKVHNGEHGSFSVDGLVVTSLKGAAASQKQQSLIGGIPQAAFEDRALAACAPILATPGKDIADKSSRKKIADNLYYMWHVPEHSNTTAAGFADGAAEHCQDAVASFTVHHKNTPVTIVLGTS